MRHIRWFSDTVFAVATIITLMLGIGSTTARAADETRHFRVTIDNKQAGNYRMSIAPQADGSIAMTGKADIKVSYLVFKYRYAYEGTEVWKNDRLWQLRSQSNDDGTTYVVNSWADDGRLRVQVNGADQTAPGDAWTTTYWKLPDAAHRNKAIPLLDADTGKNITATLQYVGTQGIVVAGQVENCAHYRVSGGGLKVDLWYDGQERLVRQESIENGSHRTVLELVRVEH
jgi:Family of unknown function (DUF6134)